MKRFASLFVLSSLLGAASLCPAQMTTYAIDPTHSQVDFSIKHMAISTVHGRFG